jgi:hypothetical protein
MVLIFYIHLSFHPVCTVCSVLPSWIEPSKRTAGRVLSFSHDSWYLPARPFRQRTALNATRTTNWVKFKDSERGEGEEGGGGGWWYLTTSLVPKMLERQWQMNEMCIRSIRGIVGPTEGRKSKCVVEICHVFITL